MSVFPSNITEALEASFQQFMQDHTVVTRPLRASDPNLTLGIMLRTWQPDERSIQMGDQREPVLNRYLFSIQNLVKHGEESVGRTLFAVKAKSVRAILYRDSTLHVRLQALTETILGSTESFKRFGIGGQRFLNNELQGQFLFVATTEYWVETETVKS